MQTLANFILAQSLHQPHWGLKTNKVTTTWSKPEGLAIEVNWNAAIYAKAKRVGISVIIRDSNNDILACMCSSERLQPNSTVARPLL